MKLIMIIGVSANAFAVDVRVDTGNNETIPFTAASFSEQKNGG